MCDGSVFYDAAVRQPKIINNFLFKVLTLYIYIDIITIETTSNSAKKIFCTFTARNLVQVKLYKIKIFCRILCLINVQGV